MDENQVLSEVKNRAGIFYDDELIDRSIKYMINGCKQYLKVAGVSEKQMDTVLALDVFAMWVNASRNNNANDITNSPAFISFICQLRHTQVDDISSSEVTNSA